MTIALTPPKDFKETSGVPGADLQKFLADGSCYSSGVGNNGNAVAVITAPEEQLLAPATKIVNTAHPPVSQHNKPISSSLADDRKEIMAVLSDMVATTAELLGGHARKGASLLGREHVSMVGGECETMKNECSTDDNHNRARQDGVLRFRQRKLYSISEGCTNQDQARTEGVCITLHEDQKVNQGADPKRKREASYGDDEDGASSQKKAALHLAKSSDEPWPLTDILTFGSNDCLIEPGSTASWNTGNRKYRYLVGRKVKYYSNAHHLSNATVATEIVSEWRAMTPPGRFLEQDKHSMLWNDIGDERAKKRVVTSLKSEKRKSKNTLNKIPKGRPMKMKKALKKMVPLPPSYPPPGYFIHHEWPKLACFNEGIQSVSI